MFFNIFSEKYSREVYFDYLEVGGVSGLLQLKKNGVSLSFLLYILYLSQMILFLISAAYSYSVLERDMITYIDVGTGVMMSTSVISKSLILFFHSDDINYAFSIFNVDFLQCCKAEKQQTKYYAWVKRTNRFALVFMVVFYTNCLLWYARPLTMGPSVFNSVNGTDTVYKIIDVLYPFNYRVSPVYELVILEEILGVFVIVVLTLSTDLLCCMFVTILCGHIEVIESALEELTHKSVSDEDYTYVFNYLSNDNLTENHTKGTALNNVDISDELETQSRLNELRFPAESQDTLNEKQKLIIQDHVKLTKLFQEKLKGPLSHVMFADIALISSAVCIVIVKMAKGFLNSAQTVRDFAFIITFITKLFVFPWFGSMIKYKSEGLHWMFYQTDWTRSDKKNRQSALLMILRAQRPLCFNAGGAMEVDLTTFEFVMRSIYACYTLLREVGD